MKRCDHCNRLKFRLRVKYMSLQFCSEKCKGGHIWATLLHAIDTSVEMPISIVTFTPAASEVNDYLSRLHSDASVRGGGVN